MNEIIFEKVGKRLKQAREQNNITLEEAGKKVDVHKSTVLRWENGETGKIKLPIIEILSKFYNVNPVWLMGYDVPMEIQFNNYNSKDSLENEHILIVAEKGEEYCYSSSSSLPVIGKVKAGYNYLATENIIGYVYTDKKISDPENYFALKIAGDSMQPILYEDDIIIVHKQNDVESGQIGIVLIDNEEATVKKIIKYDDFIELIAFNSYYPPKRLDKNSKFQIIGKVTEARISKIFE